MVKKFLLIILFIYNTSLYSTQTAAPDTNPEPNVQLSNFLININTMSADFKQIISNKHGVYLQEQTGKLQLKKPNLLHWQVLSPDPSLIVTDGNKIWHYDEDLAQVVIKKFSKEIADTKISQLLLGDPKEILAGFDINILDDKDSICFELLAKNNELDDNFVKAELSFNYKQQLIMVKVYDHLDQQTEFSFSNIKSSVDVNAFKFIIPQNVDIIED